MPGFEPPNKSRTTHTNFTPPSSKTGPSLTLFFLQVPKVWANRLPPLPWQWHVTVRGRIPGSRLKIGQNRTQAAHPSNLILQRFESCGVCKSCRKIESGNHADIIRIQPSGAFIKIAQIRALVHTLAMKPYEAKTRVVVISDAQALNAAASNALLKILEEPPEPHNAGTNRDTQIRSCSQRSYRAASTLDLIRSLKKNMAVLLSEKHGLAPQAAEIIAGMANGSFSRAQSHGPPATG